ncbi:MAG: glycosyl transferase [Lysobacterales bacterium 13-68-4]|nr:MAG: glycosyl transferase [Xanthomonadales bacterium 15-68-25]OZB68400.1 MAG: glycosyl transferase [Xanthomonadales bacterium 14-68-21]OZB73265.1 MAG: glycosyl transferase [Xanthomonadales bacterium 13-68-4]
MGNPASPTIAVLVPCHNEGVAIGRVVAGFRQALPQATIYVYDNNSTDDTRAQAATAGAVVRTERLQGKGHVVRRMFADIEADIYVLVDGDATYDADAVPAMIDLLSSEGLDMVVGSRQTDEAAAYRQGHRFGNRLLTGLTSWLFGRSFSDILSGYRVFSRRFVRSCPPLSGGFEVETELAVHALELRLPVAEVPTRYASRMAGSQSKLNTWRDGWRILLTIVRLAKNARPLLFFSSLAGLAVTAAIVLAVPLVATYMQTGLVPRFPTAILCASLVVLGSVFLACGLILDTVTVGRREQKWLAYLACSRSPVRGDAG